MQEGYDAFRKGEYFYGLTIFQEVLDVAPDVVVAHNMAGNCSLQLKDYPAAVASFKRALELQPDEPHNLSGLTQAYRLAGMIKQRDAEREHIRNSQREGRLPTNFQ
jgi:tetratricopeptide (TPR) repeat protein